MKEEKTLDYYKGYAQGYKDAIDDMKGWGIKREDSTYWPTTSPTWAPTWTGPSDITAAGPTIVTANLKNISEEDVKRIFNIGD